MRVFRVLMSILLLACLAPLISMAVAELIARMYGCELDLTSAHPCMIGNTDIGETLLTLGMMGYFLFATMPAVAAIIVVWIVVELIRWAMRRNAPAA